MCTKQALPNGWLELMGKYAINNTNEKSFAIGYAPEQIAEKSFECFFESRLFLNLIQ